MHNDIVAAALQPERVHEVHRIAADIVVPVQPVAIADRVGLQEPAERGRVHAGLVIVHAELGNPGLTSILEPAQVVRARDAVVVVSVDRERSARAVAHRHDAAALVGLSREERARTLVLDPTRQGRQELTDAIRAALAADGTLGEDAMVASVLESRDFTRPQARLATSYRPGDIVVFRKTEKGRPRAGIGHRVEAVDAATGTVRLRPDKRPRQRAESKPVDWQPARWGADVAEAFVEVPQEFRQGDRVQFTRNNYRADRLNGQTAEVVAIDPEGTSMVLEREDGRREMLDLNHLADRHVRPGWVRTIHSAQGATCDRVMAHLEAFRANTVDARSVYVAISRARIGAAVYTDSRASLTEALGLRDGAQVGAIDETMAAPDVASATPATLKGAGMAIG